MYNSAAARPTHKLTTNYQSYSIINYNIAAVAAVCVCVSFENYFPVSYIIMLYIIYSTRNYNIISRNTL